MRVRNSEFNKLIRRRDPVHRLLFGQQRCAVHFTHPSHFFPPAGARSPGAGVERMRAPGVSQPQCCHLAAMVPRWGVSSHRLHSIMEKNVSAWFNVSDALIWCSWSVSSDTILLLQLTQSFLYLLFFLYTYPIFIISRIKGFRACLFFFSCEILFCISRVRVPLFALLLLTTERF